MTDRTIEGLAELKKKLRKLDAQVQKKLLRSAALRATTPALKAAQAAAPVGSEAHRTYKGRLVAPGFLKRSVKRKTRFRDGRASVSIGVLPEAFYGVQFVELGTAKLTAAPWLVPAFVASRDEMERRFVQFLRSGIEKAARS